MKNLYITLSKIDENVYKIEGVNIPTPSFLTVAKPKIIKEVYSICNNTSSTVSFDAFKKFHISHKNFKYIIIPEIGKNSDSDKLYLKIKDYLNKK